MCISQWSILIAMLLVASIASAVVFGMSFILRQQSKSNCKPEASGVINNNTEHGSMMHDQLDLGERNNFDMTVEIDSDYINGLKAFEKDNAQQCISYLESALKKYTAFQDAEYGCPKRCRDARNVSLLQFGGVSDASDGRYMGKMMELANLVRQNAECMVGCTVASRKWISEDVHSQFMSLKPYKYLHACYSEVKREEGAGAIRRRRLL